MGSGPSSPPPRPDEASNGQSLGGPPAQGSRSSNVRRISRGAGGAECADGEVFAPEHTTLGYRDYQERRFWMRPTIQLHRHRFENKHGSKAKIALK